MPNDVINTITIGSTTYDIGGTGGGHVIEKSDGTDMTQRANLQFVDATLTDDSTNDRTVVENVHVIDDEDELDDLPDGIYIGDYDDTTPIDASVIAYDNTTSGLTADDVQDAIDELSSEKVDVVSGKGLSTNDFDNTYKGKVDKIDTSTQSASGNPISIAGLKSDQLAIDPIITFEPIQAGSGTPSPENQRPISGYDKVEVLSGCAKVWNGLISNGHLDGNGQYVADTSHGLSDYVLVAPGSYVIKTTTFTSFAAFYMSNYDGSKNYISQFVAQSHTSGNALNYTFTIPEGTRYIRFQFNQTGQISANTDSKIYVGLSTATQDNDYVIATSISESLGQTVYWGKWDLRSGKFKALGKMVDMGTLDYSYHASSSGVKIYVTTSLSDMLPTAGTHPFICECYDSVQTRGVDFTISRYNQYAENSNLYVNDSRYSADAAGAAALKAALSGVKLVYQLATPFTIQLTPRELTLLKTYAYVSTNGTNIALDYHNGEMASLGDVAKLNETIEELSRPPIRIFEEEIVSYTSTNNKYQIPCDGYIEALVPHGSGYVRLQVYDSAGSTLIRILRNADATIDEYFGTYVKKGMQARVTVSGLSDVSVKFRAMA